MTFLLRNLVLFHVLALAFFFTWVHGGTRVEYLAAAPCLEGLLLRILGHPGITTSSTVAECKRALYDGKYVDWDHRTEAQSYAKSFPKELLVSRRGAVAPLDALLTELD